MYYAGNCKFLVSFETKDERNLFVESRPSYYAEDARSARMYPQFEISKRNPLEVFNDRFEVEEYDTYLLHGIIEQF